MTTDPFLQARIQLTEADAKPRELEALAAALEKETLEHVQGVQLTRNLFRGQRDVDPLVVGTVLLTFIPIVLPKVLEFLQAWAMRRENSSIRVKITAKDKTVEIEVPSSLSPEEARRWIIMVKQNLASGVRAK
jgi:hypothetical protein